MMPYNHVADKGAGRNSVVSLRLSILRTGRAITTVASVPGLMGAAPAVLSVSPEVVVPRAWLVGGRVRPPAMAKLQHLRVCVDTLHFRDSVVHVPTAYGSHGPSCPHALLCEVLF